MSPLRIADLEAADVVGVHAEGGVGLDVHLPGAAELVEVVDVQPAQVDLQRVEDFAQRHVPCVLHLVRSMSTYNCGVLAREDAQQAGQAPTSVPCCRVATSLSVASWSASRPALPRSSIMTENRPWCPVRGPAAGANTATLASSISANLARSVPARAFGAQLGRLAARRTDRAPRTSCPGASRWPPGRTTCRKCGSCGRRPASCERSRRCGP